MALSTGKAVGIAVGCSVGAFLMGFLVMFCLCRIYLNSPEPPDPLAHSKFLKNVAEHLYNVSHPGTFDVSGGQRHFWLHYAVRKFVSEFVGGSGTDMAHGGLPFDSNKFHQLAGGAHDDWDKLLEMEEKDRHDTLVHFICRVIYLRIIPDGNCSITLLPPDILSTYQLMLTKIPPRGLPTENPPDCIWKRRTSGEQARESQMLLQYWRAFTVYCCTERYKIPMTDKLNKDGMNRPGCIGIHWDSTFAYHSDEYGMWEDDPRMPNILALESALRDALTPFWKYRDAKRDTEEAKHAPFQGPKARKELRRLIADFADLALCAFKNPEPVEYYWPSSKIHDGPSFEEGGGRLSCFGSRRRVPVPGCESEDQDGSVATVIDQPPLYNDSGILWSYFENGGHRSLQEMVESCRKRQRDKGDLETEVEREERESKTDRLRRIEATEPYQIWSGTKTPGWDGATNFF